MKKWIVILLALTSCAAQKQSTDDACFLDKALAGSVFFTDGQQSVRELSWNPHPSFKGVYLKHLVSGKNTGNQISCHIVKIEPGCMLDTHVHDGKAELHEVVAGSGTMYLDGKEIAYFKGQVTFIPSNTRHKVVAGKEGMYLCAKFVPALQ
jgi:quercetin dioxygenase-like cupin family protein